MIDFTQYLVKNNTVYIYVLIDPRDNKIRYVGQTYNVKERYINHCEKQQEDNHRTHWLMLLRSIAIKPIMQIIEECDETNWAERETYWIKYYREQGCRLVNATDGGEGIKGYKHTEETKRKISAASSGENNGMYGRTHTDKVKQEQSERRKGKRGPFYGEKRENASGEHNPWYGKHHTPEVCEHLSILAKRRVGALNSNAKLTEDQAREIKYSSLPYSQLMKIYKVAKSTVHQIKKGKTWKHL